MGRRRRLWSPLGGCGLLSLALLLALGGPVLFQTSAIEVGVLTDSTKVTCLYINFNINFSITYETENSDYGDTSFVLPDNLTYGERTCGDNSSDAYLVILFGNGNSWMVSFSKTKYLYQGNITFTYNTSDTELFPDAKRIGPVTIHAAYPTFPVELNTVYTCESVSSLETENVTQYIWNVTLQAFIQNGSLSSEKTHCSRDVQRTTSTTTSTSASTSTTTATTTRLTTEVTNTTTRLTTEVTNTTTRLTTKVTNTTTHLTRPSPTTKLSAINITTVKPWAKPTTGTYAVTNNYTICLLANMALQLNVSGQIDMLIDIDPNTTEANGSCGAEVAFLNLKDTNAEINFVFAIRNITYAVFYLREVTVIVYDATNETHSATNSNLNYWQATLGKSFVCRKETVLEVNRYVNINVFNIQLQPFGVKESQFSPAARLLIYAQEWKSISQPTMEYWIVGSGNSG